MRLADFSPLHRNEASGALGGLTRLRRFAQDDAHIFCTREQVRSEVLGCLDFVRSVYGLFGFSFRVRLSTRPELYVGDLSTWDEAEAALRGALTDFLRPQRGGELAAATAAVGAGVGVGAGAGAGDATVQIDVDEGGGAFYGPKLDVTVKDAVGREHQCATVQLDFQLPQRFRLQYTHADGTLRTPVMIHRAIMGSLERFMGVLIEHTAGRWPFWLNPRQVVVATVADRHSAYARLVCDQLTRLTPAAYISSGDAGEAVAAEVDASAETVSRKVRDAQVAQVSVVAVVGDAEQANGTVTLRFRDRATAVDFTRLRAAAAAAGGGGSGQGVAAPAVVVPEKPAPLTLQLSEAVELLRRWAALPTRQADWASASTSTVP